MELDRIVLVALVNRRGQVLLRSRDQVSTVGANRWSLPGGGVYREESAETAALRLVREQTSLSIDSPLRSAWWGNMSSPKAEVHLFAASTGATNADLPFDPVPGAVARFGGYVLEFVSGSEVLSGRSFTPMSGYVLPSFLGSRIYRELVTVTDPDKLV
jgi:8-oxo-dGTP pyrophosphatase MutT (NUDIX family)